MVKLPIGVDIDILLNDLRDFCWEAADILLHYSSILRDPNIKSNIIEKKDNDSPVTKADIEANELIIKRINEKYRNIGWKILSEETVKVELKNDYKKFRVVMGS